MRLFVCQPHRASSPCLSICCWNFKSGCGNCSRLSNAALAVPVPSTWHDSWPTNTIPLKARLTATTEIRKQQTNRQSLRVAFSLGKHTNTRTPPRCPCPSIPFAYYVHAEVKIVDIVNICIVSHMSICWSLSFRGSVISIYVFLS